jgi:hypothetical protein
MWWKNYIKRAIKYIAEDDCLLRCLPYSLVEIAPVKQALSVPETSLNFYQTTVLKISDSR